MRLLLAFSLLVLGSAPIAAQEQPLIISQNHLMGVMQNNKQIIPLAYQALYHLAENPEIFLAKKNHKWGWIDKTGKAVIPIIYEAFDAMIAFKLDGPSFLSKEDIIALNKDGKWGGLNYEGKELIPFEYQFLMPNDNVETETFAAQKNNEVIEINNKNKVLHKLPFKYLCGVFSLSSETEFGTYYAVSNNGSSVSFYNIKTKKVDKILPEEPNMVGYMNGSYFLMNSQGNILQKGYDELSYYFPSGFIARKGNFWGYIDGKGQELIAPQQYNDIHPFIFNNSVEFYGVQQDGVWEILTKDEKPICNLTFEDIYPYSGNTSPFSVKVDGKWGCINHYGKWVIQPSYEEAFLIYNDQPGSWPAVKKDGKYGYIDNSGNVIFDFQFDYAEPFYEGGNDALVQKGQTFGRIDRDGKVTWE